MGKLVLGIVVVFVLDLALILFIRSGGDLVDLAAIETLSVDPILISRALDVPETPAPDPPNKNIYEVHGPIATVSPSKVVRMGERVRPNKKVKIAGKVHNPPLRSNTIKEQAETFTDTVISIERASFVPDHQNSRVEAPRTTPKEAPAINFTPIKRSFFSRARHVAKKPYDWAKAFASKVF